MSMNYKQSYITWVGVIPKEWEILPTKYVFHNKKNVAGVNEDKYERLALTMKGVLKREKDDNEGLQPESFASYQIVEKNQIIFKLIDLENIKTSRVGLSPYKGLVSPAYIVLGNEKKDNRFYEYYYLTMWFYDVFNYLGNSGVRSSLSATELLNLPIIRPLYGEKKAIADFLDCECEKIHSIITDIESQIEILKAYRKAVITEAVTKGLNKSVEQRDSGISWIGGIPKHWDIKRLKFLGRARNGLTYAPEDINENGILVLRSSNIQNDKLAFDDNVFVDMKIPHEIILRENDLLICSRNGSRELIGKCALIDKQIAGQTYGAFMCVFRSEFNRFIHYALLSEVFSYYLGTYLTTTINQLTNTNLGNIKIPIPMNVDEQQAIADYLDEKCAKIEDIIKDKQEALETIKEYKKSLIYEYVTGKKRVKEAK